MTVTRYLLCGAALLLARAGFAQAPPTPSEKLLIVSPVVGEVIDGGEKARFGLFSYYAADEFVEASFYRSLTPDSAITLRSRLRDGRLLPRPFTQPEFLAVRQTIERRLKELGEAVPKAAAVGVGNPGIKRAAPATSADYPFALGTSYRIETYEGTTFQGQLVSMSLTALDFESPELGKVTVQRANIKEVTKLEAAPVPGKPSNYYDIGNGNRLFFGPTARGLRKNEGSLQSVNLYLLGVNYGLTDNFSLGGYASVVPGLAPNEQLLVFTPKLSFKLRENLHTGAGLLYLRVPFDNGTQQGTGIGIAYGVVTKGTADDNFTAGLGYGFVDNEIGSTPLILLGGQTRVSRRVSLLTENYIIAHSEAGMGGFYGMKINWRRTSLGLGALYAYTFPHTDNFGFGSQQQGGKFFSTYIIPVYIDFTFRFGKGLKRD